MNDDDQPTDLHQIHTAVKGCKTYLGWILLLMLLPTLVLLVVGILSAIAGAVIKKNTPSSK